MKAFFFTVLYQPLYNLFIFLVAIIPTHNLGLAIIALTLLVRLALRPLKVKSIESQIKQQALQPELKELQERHKGDRSGLTAAQLQLYRDRGINPASGCLPTLVQIVIVIGLFYVFRNGLGPERQGDLYPFIHFPSSVRTTFLWVKDLTQQDSLLLLPLAAAVVQFFFGRSLAQTMPPPANPEDMAAIMTKQMIYIAPVATFLFARTLPAGLSLYWAISSLIEWAQQVALTRQAKRLTQSRAKITVRRKEEP